MADIRLDDRNFCMGTYVGTFCSMDDANSRLVTRNTSNGPVGTQYTLSPSLSTEVLNLEYTGPRDLSATQFDGPLPFYSLDSDNISYWELNKITSNLVRISYSDVSGKNYTAMAIEHYDTVMDEVTVTGTGKIKVSNALNIDVGTRLLLGPSYGAGSDGSYEQVDVTSVSGGYVFVTTSVGSEVTAPINFYDTGNKVTFSKYIYAFSSDGYIDKLDLNYNVVETVVNELYSNIDCASWSNAYNAIGFIRRYNQNLLYLDPYQSYQIIKSHTIMTQRAIINTTLSLDTWRVYDIVFDDLSIYRLQTGMTTVDDGGVYIDNTTWDGKYSYHQDTISPYTKNITIYSSPNAVTLNEKSVVFTTIVRDQYGIGLTGKQVNFYESDAYGVFDPIDGIAVTNASGIATIIYNLNKPGGDPDSFPLDHDLPITVSTNGASTYTGSQYVWDGMNIIVKRKYISENDGLILDILNEFSVDTYTDEIEDKDIDVYINAKSKFQFPGGDWTVEGDPNDITPSIEQLRSFESTSDFDQIDEGFETGAYIDQIKQISDEGQVSQTYVSRHVLTDHQDTTELDQFQFVEDAIPAFWSEKNPIGTDIWIRLRPFAYSLNQSTLVFKIKEFSYTGEELWRDVTSFCIVTTFDAGGGLLGLDILYDSPLDFHHNGVVYVTILVYDNASIPNIITTDYWFKIIPDYKSPYIVNEYPERESEDVTIFTDISFDILDEGVGIDISTLEFYINNRKKSPIITKIDNGYHIYYNPPEDLFYGQTVEITVKVKDSSSNANFLYDMWRFYVEGSTGPWIDIDSFYPKNCVKGVPRKWSEVSFNVYGINDTGVNADSIVVHIGGKERDVTVTPIIYRIS